MAVAILGGRNDGLSAPSPTPSPAVPSASPSGVAAPSPSAAQGRVVTLYHDDSDRPAPEVGGTTVVCDFHIRGTVFDYRAGNEYRMEPVSVVPPGTRFIGTQHSSDERGEWRSDVISAPEGEWVLHIGGTHIHPAQRRSVTVRCPARRTPVPTPTPRVTASPHPAGTVTGAVQTFPLGPLTGEIAFVIAVEPQRDPSTRTVYAVPLDGSRARLAVRYRGPDYPSGAVDTNEVRRQLSPDGRRLVLSIGVGAATREFDLVIVDLETGAVVSLTRTPDFEETNPAWSPDGSRIAFVRRVPDRIQSEVRVMNADGSGERLIFTGVEGAFPRIWGWTADSRSLAYDPINFEDSNYQVRELTTGATWQGGGTFLGGDLRAASPQFAGGFWSSPRMAQFSEVRVGDPFGAPPRAVARADLDPPSAGSASFTRARWHPTRDLVLTVREAVASSMSVVPLDGTAQRTVGTGRPYLAEWSADGTGIIYVTPRPLGTGPSNILVQRLDGALGTEPDNSPFVVGTTITDLAVRKY